jgi:hypothetical protein
MLKTIIALSFFLIVGFHSVKSQTATAPTNGSGTFADPYEIETLENLYWISSNQANWNKYYIQVADIDATETSTWFSGAGWLPIGDLQNSWSFPPLSLFTGKYNGQGYEISNLYVNRPSTRGIGLFGSTRNSKISNVNLLNASITGGEGTAGICGASYVGDTIEFCFSSGTITGARCAAGIAGNVWVPDGQPTGYIRISNCYSSASISGNTECGGIVGRMSCTFASPAEIINCYATGDVTATTNWAGGLVGYFYSGGKVRNCYSTGVVTGPNSGGMVGPAGNSTWTNCFWDTESSGKLTSAKGTGKTTAEMKNKTTYTNATWDFQCESANGLNDFWGLAAIVNNGYPFLSFIGEISDDCYCVWEGDISQEWASTENWTNEAVPDIYKIVIIPQSAVSFPILTGNGFADKMEIELNASLILTDNASLTIDDDVVNEGSIIVQSSVSGDASLIVAGEISGSGIYRCERYLSENQWHLVSSPITTGTAGVFEDIWLRAYNESSNAFGDYIVPTETPLPIGEGFSVWAPTAQTRTFTGTINNSSVTKTLQRSPDGGDVLNFGWNLIGNPYPCAIDLDAASGWTKNNVGRAVYVWDGGLGGGQYRVYLAASGTEQGIAANGGSRYVAMGQGFFMQAITDGATITMDKPIRVHNAIEFRDSEVISDMINISVSGNGFSDESVIYYKAEADENFDFYYDAAKFYGTSSAPQLYTKKQDNMLTINAINEFDELNGKYVYLEVGAVGEYMLEFSHSMQTYLPVLKDLFTEQYIYPGQNYVFFANPDDNSQRFQFSDDLTGITEETANDISVWAFENVLRVELPINDKIEKIGVYSINGQLIMEFVEPEKNLSNLAPAMYLVKVNSKQSTKTEKIFVR